MLMRVHIVMIAVLFAALPCPAATPDGSTEARAIPLKQRSAERAVEEEFALMMKLYRYTPLLAMRDALKVAFREAKAGNTSARIDPGWGHASLDHNGRLISNWWFKTPRGKRDVYFDTGTLIDTPGEVARQESARAQYMSRMASTLKVQ